MKQIELNSARTYSIAFIEHGTPISYLISLHQIINENSEAAFAMMDNIDPILDLKPGERLTMNFNRDSKDSAGFIRRNN